MKNNASHVLFFIIIFVNCNLINFFSYLLVCLCTLCVCNAERFYVMSFFPSSLFCFFVMLLLLCLSYHIMVRSKKNNSVFPFINIQMRVIDWCLNGYCHHFAPLPTMLPFLYLLSSISFSIFFCFIFSYVHKCPTFLLFFYSQQARILISN